MVMDIRIFQNAQEAASSIKGAKKIHSKTLQIKERAIDNSMEPRKEERVKTECLQRSKEKVIKTINHHAPNNARFAVIVSEEATFDIKEKTKKVSLPNLLSLYLANWDYYTECNMHLRLDVDYY